MIPLLPDVPFLASILGVYGDDAVQILPLHALKSSHGPIRPQLLAVVSIRNDTLHSRIHEIARHKQRYDVRRGSAVLKLEKNILAGGVGEYVFVKFQLLRLLGVSLKPRY